MTGLLIFLACGTTLTDGEDLESAISTLLIKTDESWYGVNYGPYQAGPTDITVLKFNIPAHTTLPWHSHPTPNAAYVLSGTIEVESGGGKFYRVLKAGEVLAEMVDCVRRGRTGETPVELVAFCAGPPH